MVAPAFKELIFNQRGLIKDPYKCYKTREEQRQRDTERFQRRGGLFGGKSDMEGPQRMRIIEVDSIFELLSVQTQRYTLG